MQPIQQARVAKLVEALRNRMQPYVAAQTRGEKDAWVQRQVDEAEDLSGAAFGEAMLSTIGWGSPPADLHAAVVMA